MPFLTNRQLNTIRGKSLAGKATRDEILSVFAHVDAYEEALDNWEQDGNGDFMGTEGWRRAVGLPEEDC